MSRSGNRKRGISFTWPDQYLVAVSIGIFVILSVIMVREASVVWRYIVKDVFKGGMICNKLQASFLPENVNMLVSLTPNCAVYV